MGPNEIIIIFTVALLIGLSKGGLGGPVPVSLGLPLLSQIMPVPQAVGIMLPLLIFADMFAMRAYWKQWDMKMIRLMLPPAFLGILLGARLLSTLPDNTLRHILGIFTLIIVIYIYANELLTSLKYEHHNWHGRLAGFASGFGSALANAGGPPITGYLLLQKVKPINFIGTFTLFFTAVNLLKIPSFIVEGIIDINEFLGIIWVIPAIPLGVWIGHFVVTRMNAQLFQQIMLIALLIAGLYMLLGTPPQTETAILQFPCGDVFFCGISN